MSWNIIEDWESMPHMNEDQTVAYFDTLPDETADKLSAVFRLLSREPEGEARRLTARLVRALLKWSD